MNLTDKRLRELDDPTLTTQERTRLRCRLAADFAQVGQYEAARDVLGGLWRGIGERPHLEGIDERTSAEVLLQCGALSGWLGASGQVAGAQEKAKDLISEGAALFEKLGETARAALARSDLALCYWREGACSDARAVMAHALEGIAGADAELRAIVSLRSVTVECAAGNLINALDILKGIAPTLDESDNHALRGSFHNLHAITLRRLGSVERRGDYSDKAILEYTAAAYHWEQAGHERYVALSENNLAFLLHKLGRHADAHKHLDRAQLIYTRLKDAGSLAQVDDTRARVLLAERKYAEANRVLAGARETFERGGDSALLADALTLQGVVWARRGGYESSLAVLRSAAEMAERVGAHASAGRAWLTLLEEHGARRGLESADVYDAYVRADELLRDTQDAGDVARLRACARIVMRRLAGWRLTERNFTLRGAIQELEARFIGQALDETGGSVTRAAKLLGMGHQSLSIILRTRHKKLLSKRTPPQKRRKSIIEKPED